MKNLKLPHILPAVGLLVIAALGNARAFDFPKKFMAVTKVDAQGNRYKQVTIPEDGKAGDCRISNGSTLTFYPNGTGTFGASVMTTKTSSGDVWHARFDVQVLNYPTGFHLGQWDTPFRMLAVDPIRNVPIGWYNWGGMTFTFDPAAFEHIDGVVWDADC